MTFDITRTSTYCDEEQKPCNRAEFNKDSDCWCVEINTLSDLMNLIAEVDEQLVISATHIEIYDSWRE